MKKKTVAVLFGGRSAEHDISVRSARFIIRAINKSRYNIIPIFIDRSGRFEIPHRAEVDVVFPVLHGPYGEDGTIQGLLAHHGIPFVGASVLGSAIGMDKDVQKRLLRDAGLPVVRFRTVRNKSDIPSFAAAKTGLGLPFFVKPSSLGSSIGISRVSAPNAYKKAVALAFGHGHKIILEEAVTGREFEVAVLLDPESVVSVPGEVISGGFYTYDAKYGELSAARTDVPAKIPAAIKRKMMELAETAVSVLELESMARVDFFMNSAGRIYINEVNTIPGFTEISLFPALLAHSGIDAEQMTERLIKGAISRHGQGGHAKIRAG